MSIQELGPLQEKWLQALESGEFKQGSGFLHIVTTKFDEYDQESEVADEFCCLGVLCQAMAIPPVPGDHRVLSIDRVLPAGVGETKVSYSYGIDDEDSNADTLPESLVERLNFMDAEGSFVSPIKVKGTTYRTLTCLNDHGEVSFQEIAQIIRSDPSNVFLEAA